MSNGQGRRQFTDEFKRDVVDRGEAVEALGQIAGFDDRGRLQAGGLPSGRNRRAEPAGRVPARVPDCRTPSLPQAHHG